MDRKKCSKCKKIKPINEFRFIKSRNNYRTECHQCELEYGAEYRINNKNIIKERNKKYRKNNPDKVKRWKKNWFKRYYKKNKELIIGKNKKWCNDNPEKKRELDRKYQENNPDKVKASMKKYLQTKKGKETKLKYKIKFKLMHPEYYNEYSKKWKKENPEKYKQKQKRRYSNITNKLNNRLSNSINRSLRGKKDKRHWEDLVGYTINDLMIHLEKQFKPGMSWDNYGLKGWSIDHIRPVSSFNFSSYEDKEFKECWSLNNLQPLWHIENIKKGNKQRLEVSILE